MGSKTQAAGPSALQPPQSQLLSPKLNSALFLVLVVPAVAWHKVPVSYLVARMDFTACTELCYYLYLPVYSLLELQTI